LDSQGGEVERGKGDRFAGAKEGVQIGKSRVQNDKVKKEGSKTRLEVSLRSNEYVQLKSPWGRARNVPKCTVTW